MSRVELLEMEGSPLALVLVAVLLSLLCVAWAWGVPQLLRDLHRAGMARVRNDRGGPVRARWRWLTLRSTYDPCYRAGQRIESQLRPTVPLHPIIDLRRKKP